MCHRQRPYPAWMRGSSPHGWVHGVSLAVTHDPCLWIFIYRTAVTSIALFLNEMTLAVLIAGRLILTMNKHDRIV